MTSQVAARRIYAQPGPVTPPAASPLLTEIRRIADKELAPQVVEIDRDGHYPEDILRSAGAAGAFRQHLPRANPSGDGMAATIEAMAILGEHCLSTAFLGWCQNACAYYMELSDNTFLKRTILPRVAAGERLGGTALSNPMKSFSGIERLLLKGKAVKGGFRVSGRLPWVSNLGDGHLFGAIFQLADSQHTVMAMTDCAWEGLSITQNVSFTALEGTRTFCVRFDDVFVPEDWVLADPADAIVPKIKPGFILMQAGMAIGLVRDCVAIMRRANRRLDHVNRFLDDPPDEIESALFTAEEEVGTLAATPLETDRDFLRRVLSVRADASELSLKAAQSAMLHAGARGYVAQSAAQRRLRESYFVAIVTPALKHLRKELANLS
ncbi:MAG: acyl-CoA/acyl-ACP dehydrogenase [Rhodospirillales bacterium]|jgi:alkylation response protein AidB-like acyl-CoA dehydrogenase|nr:acyl-CoA/acyl-ACP dehydrogenase [Rhodospirillales bacterium]